MRTNKLKLKHQIILIVILSVIIIMFMEMYYYFSFFNLTQSRAVDYENKIIEQSRVKIDLVLGEVKRNTNTIIYDKKVQNFMLEKNIYQRNIVYGPYVLDLIEYMRLFDSLVYGICLYNNFNDKINDQSTQEAVFFNKKYVDFIEKYRSKLTTPSNGKFTSMYFDENNKKELFFYISPIIEAIGGEKFSQRIGYCSIVIDIDKLKKLIENTELTRNSSLYILNDKNEIVVSNNEKGKEPFSQNLLQHAFNKASTLKKTYLNGQEVIIQEKKLEQALGWRIVSIIPVNELALDMVPIRNLGIFASIGIFISLLIVWWFLLNSITKPVFSLIRDMKKIGNNFSGRRVRVHSTNEIGVLASEVNSMLGKIDEITKKTFYTQSKLYEAELCRRQAEFSTLQSQINPHFLYNTLNCIGSIGLANGIKEIAQISSCMSKIFRYSIKGEDLVNISEEIDCITAYINIIEIRYLDKYKIDIKIEETLNELKTPKMILQPIIENSVFHGLENVYKDGVLRIEGKLDAEGDVVFSIYDSGNGISKERLEKIKNNLSMNSSQSIKTNVETNIGLVNINNRIKFLFGDNYGLDIDSEEGNWTLVTVKIPSIKRNE